MKSSEIITAVLNRYKFWASKNPNSASSFIPNANATSFYLMKNRGDNQSHIQIRLSNHGTYLKTWTDREHLGNSVNRYDPTHSINISIVFVDDSSDITNDCTGQKNCDGCVLPVCKPQTFDGQDQIGRHFKVYQYIYNSNEILPRYINAITKAIFEASYKGVYIDPLRNIQRAAKHKELVSSTELQNIDNNKDLNENINMKQNRIRLTESQLHRVIKESVKRVLKESHKQKNKKNLQESSSLFSKMYEECYSAISQADVNGLITPHDNIEDNMYDLLEFCPHFKDSQYDAWYKAMVEAWKNYDEWDSNWYEDDF